MQRLTLGLAEVGRDQVALVGGKAAGLGELTRIDGIDVPAGFVVTTDAHRRAGEGGDVPSDVAAAIEAAAAELGEGEPVAVRSSATAEDLPTASFAGQHDTFLDVVGPAAIVEAVQRCWASLGTDHAVAYRQQQGIHEGDVAMAVVVQRMVPAETSGVLFTADPITGHRQVAAVEAVQGLGEALVSGRVAADSWHVQGGEVVARSDDAALLTDAEVVELADLGRRIEAHLGGPQDVEWCRADGRWWFVQSRPITTLFPIPGPVDDGEHHVYVSVGHQQMMTDPMRPLGLSVWQLKARPVMREAAGRLFVEVTQALASPAGRAAVLGGLGASDPLTGDALQAIVDREGFLPPAPDEAPSVPTPDTTTRRSPPIPRSSVGWWPRPRRPSPPRPPPSRAGPASTSWPPSAPTSRRRSSSSSTRPAPR